jgi:hypothetical protein
VLRRLASRIRWAKYLPYFCFQTIEEIISMIELAYESVEVNPLKITIYNTVMDGLIENGASSLHAGPARLYRPTTPKPLCAAGI